MRSLKQYPFPSKQADPLEAPFCTSSVSELSADLGCPLLAIAQTASSLSLMPTGRDRVRPIPPCLLEETALEGPQLLAPIEKRSDKYQQANGR